MQALPDRIDIRLAGRPALEIEVPGSKSITNRALIVASLADGRSRVEGCLEAEDTEVMKRSLMALGFGVDDRGSLVEIEGTNGVIPRDEASLDLRLSGTSIRFLAALCSLGKGRYRLDGNARMRERPIGDLLAALQGLGVDARSLGSNDCPPIEIDTAGLGGGLVKVAGERSSQFLSALLMAAPHAEREIVVEVEGELQSKPFVDMTLEVMRDFGVEVEREGYSRFRVPLTGYRARRYEVEGDAMAAGYFWAAAAVTGGSVTVTNLGSRSLQGDRRLADVLGEMGCQVEWGEQYCRVSGPSDGRLRGGSFDLNDMPDQAQTLAVVGLFASEPLEIRNVWNLRIKETDRLRALASELARFGAAVEERRDGLLVTPPAELHAAAVHTYGDHRMAMAFAVAGLRVPGTSILDPACVAKTYPHFFGDFSRLSDSGGGVVAR